MFKIGDFSKLGRVTVKTLRYYDQIGLLTPAEVDPFTGYRTYTADQMDRLNRILALKDLGFTLNQIGSLLDEGLSVEEMHGMFRLRQAEIEAALDEERERLARVAARLEQIRQGDDMAYDVVLKEIDPVTIASVRGTIPTYGDVGMLYGELFGHLGQHGIHPAGPPLAIYHDPEYREADVDAEAGVPIDADAPASGRVSVRTLPGGSVATCIHRGGYDTIGQAYTALMAWIERNGYAVAGPNREIYLRGPDDSGEPDGYVTEVQFPVTK
jgi:effector-binding domain-containing protein